MDFELINFNESSSNLFLDFGGTKIDEIEINGRALASEKIVWNKLFLSLPNEAL